MRWAWTGVLLLVACSSTVDSGLVGTNLSRPTVATERAPSDGSTDVSLPPDLSAPTAPTETTGTTVSAPGRRPEGFATTQAIVTKSDGTTCELCLWLAERPGQRSLGLMFVTDLGPADGMAFRYQDPHTGSFWMKSTVLPLSIAFFAPDGGFVSSFDMDPCTTRTCPRYPTPVDFLVAVEVPQGDLERLGLVAGSHLELLDVPCTF